MLKRKVFISDDRIFEYSGHEDLKKAIEYIDKKTDYDVNMIWENLLRVYNLTDIRNTLYLNYILSTNSLANAKREKKDNSVIIFFMPYSMQIEDDFLGYIQNLLNNIPIILVVMNKQDAYWIKEKCLELKKQNYSIFVFYGNNIIEWISDHEKILNDYEYICVIKDYLCCKNPLSEKVFKDNVWFNLIGNNYYIENVIKLFLENPKMGFLAPLESYHDKFFTDIGDSWSDCFFETKKLAKKLELKCNISPVKKPFGYSGSFWCRKKILAPLFDKRNTIKEYINSTNSEITFKVLDRILIYMAQNANFYAGTVMTSDSILIINNDLQYLLQKMIYRTQIDFGKRSYNDLVDVWRNKQLLDFADKFDQIYIYGAGDHGRKAYKILCDIEGNPNSLFGITINQINEIDINKRETIVLLAVKDKYHLEIINHLSKLGYENILILNKKIRNYIL